ncbi:MAG: response regulator [Pedobacter sp.]|nr:response regulator [Chitinophagaceae bacterium]
MIPIHILLVEDNEGDIILTTEALEEGSITSTLSVVRDGKLAIDFLTQTGNYTDALLPDLILLDINLPKKNGHEVLRFIKSIDHLKHIPVIMLTTSSSEKDIEMAYNNLANCYITKPVDVGDFMAAIAKIEDFWVSMA